MSCLSPARGGRRRWRSVVLAAVLAVGAAVGSTAGALPAPPEPLIQQAHPRAPTPPQVTASAYLLVEGATGQVLAERDADRPRPVASTIKILTALTVMERREEPESVTIPAQAGGLEGARTSVDPGETWTVGQLLDALLVRSGNDAAVALAVDTAGSVEAFIALMQSDAQTLGLDLTLATPSGLEDTNRLTARDLAVLSLVAMREPAFRSRAQARQVTLPDLGLVDNRNLLLPRYEGATGIKTGFTTASGWSVVAAAERDGRELIAVVLGSTDDQSRFTDAAALLDHGFNAYERVTVGRTTRLRLGGGWANVGLSGDFVTVPTGTNVDVSWRAPLRYDQPVTPGVVRISGHEPFELEPRAVVLDRRDAPSPAGRAGQQIADVVHAALRLLALDHAAAF